MPFVPSNPLDAHLVHSCGGEAEKQELIDAINAGGSGSGTVTSVDVDGGTTGLTTSGGPITTSGVITIDGILNVSNGGTGVNSLGGAALIASNAGGGVEEISWGVVGSVFLGKGLLLEPQFLVMDGDAQINGSGTITIKNHVVSYVKIQQASASTLLGNPTGSTANIQEITLGSGLAFSGSVLNTVGGGSGTVTNVSVVTANGVSGSVANPTTTPAITLTLGAITPSSVNGNTITVGTGTITLNTFTLTVTATSSISGTNTGDQTITLTSDVTGSGTGSFATTIASHAVTYAKMQQESASTILGNPTGGTADVQEITLSSVLGFSGSVLTFASQAKNTVFAGPTSGANAVPTFRPAIGADMVFDAAANLFIGGGGLSVTADTGSNLGIDNIGIGGSYQGSTPVALNAVTDGNDNVALGDSALRVVTTGSRNVAIGTLALTILASSASDNTGLGHSALSSVSSGQKNCAVGVSSGFNLQTGSNNTFLGYQTSTSGASAGSISNSIAIGRSAFVSDSNQCIIGSSIASTFAVSIGFSGNVAPSNASIISTGQGFLYWDFTPSASKLLIKGKDTGGTVFTASLSGANTGDQTITLTGDVTGSGTGSFATTISNNAVAYSKMQQASAFTLIGNPTSGTANISEITLGPGIGFTGTVIESNWTTSDISVNTEIPASSTTSIIEDPYIIESNVATILDATALLDLRVYNYPFVDSRPGSAMTIPDNNSFSPAGPFILDSGILLEVAGPSASDTVGGLINIL